MSEVSARREPDRAPVGASGAELEGQAALVTGGSRGIGRAIAEALAAGGARVAVVARDGARAAEAAAALPGSGHAGFGCDVADPTAAGEVVKAVEGGVGELSILVNNAGITRDNILLRLKDEDWDEVLRGQPEGGVQPDTGGCARHDEAPGRGDPERHLRGGLDGNAGQANYAASKAGLIGLTKSVARELASRNVRCNAIAPGFIRTDMTAELGAAVLQELAAKIPLERLGEPADVAGVARFLAGPGARYITGQVIAVDGGMAM